MAPLSGFPGANIGTDVRRIAWEVGREGVIHPSHLSLVVTHLGLKKHEVFVCSYQKNLARTMLIKKAPV